MTLNDFNKKIDKDGWVVFPEVIDQSTLEKLRNGLDIACIECQEIMVKGNGPSFTTTEQCFF